MSTADKTAHPAIAGDLGPSQQSISEGQSRHRRAGLAFSLPGLILLLLFLAGPFLVAIGLSFTSERLASPLPARFIGFDNYGATLASPSFRKALGNNVWFTLVVVPVQTAFALGLAMLVKQRMRGV
jgi:multiple sugar transport system permease protein